MDNLETVNGVQPLAFSAKTFVLDVWQDSEYTSV